MNTATIVILVIFAITACLVLLFFFGNRIEHIVEVIQTFFGVIAILLFIVVVLAIGISLIINAINNNNVGLGLVGALLIGGLIFLAAFIIVSSRRN